MTKPHVHLDRLQQMLLDIAISTARLRAMIDEAQTWTARVQNSPPAASVKTWATQESRVKTRA